MTPQLIHVRDEWLIIIYEGGTTAEVLFKTPDEDVASHLMPVLETAWSLGADSTPTPQPHSRFRLSLSYDEEWTVHQRDSPSILWSSPRELEAHLGLRAIRRAFTLGATIGRKS